MPSLTVSIDIPASPEQVWEVLSEPKRLPEWLVGHDGFVGETPGQATAGQTYTQKLKVMNMPIQIAWKVDKAEAPSLLEMTGTGMMNMQSKTILMITPTEGGSVLSYETQYGGSPMLEGPAGQMLVKQGEKTLRESLENLKKLLS